MAEETLQASLPGQEKKSKKRELSGVVVSDKMKDTIVVAVTRYVKHPKYKKYMKRVKRYHAQDKGNERKVGEKVRIQECTPVSKRTHFVVIS